MHFLKLISLLSFLYLSSCEVSEEKKARLLSAVSNYYNFQPNLGHVTSNGILRSVHRVVSDPVKKHINKLGTTKLRHGIPTSTNSQEANRLKRQVRTIPGGETLQDPDDPTYQILAEEALLKYISESADKEPLALLSVERVTTQVVNGILTRINFLAVPIYNRQGLIKKCFSKILDGIPSKWIPAKEINVTCHDLVTGPGGEIVRNPDDPTYQQLAKESLQKYILESLDKKPYTLLRVEKVTTQLVAGVFTRIDFLAVPKDNNFFLIIKCHSDILEQNWLNIKNINVSCHIYNHRLKRQVPVRSGEPVVQDPDDPTYQQLAKESLQKYISESLDKKPYTLLRVEKVTTQLVAGVFTRIDFLAVPKDNNFFLIIKCHSDILEQNWLNIKNINVSCHIYNHRLQRQVPVSSGEPVVRDPDDPTFIQLAKESLQKYVVESDVNEPLRLLGVERVTTQLVAGVLTRIDFLAVPKDDRFLLVIKCHSDILEQKWLNIKSINVSCAVDNHRFKRQARTAPGEIINQNPEDPTYQQLAKESLQKYVLESADKEPHTLLAVKRVSTQVVAGLLVRINFLAVPNYNPNGLVKTCFSKIWEPPAEGPENKEIQVSCEIVRTIPGGVTEEDPNDQTNQQLAEESLQKYVLESPDKKPHRLLGVEKVTSQVVSGIIIRINFVAAPIDNHEGLIKNCFSEIWEKPSGPLLRRKEINVSCVTDYHRLKRQVAIGGEVEQDPHDPIYIKLAEESLEKYVSESADKTPRRLLSVDRVTTQVVAGLLTRINFVAEPYGNKYPFVDMCNSKILEQKWANIKKITVFCVLTPAN